MARILKFVNFVILFLFLFLVISEVGGRKLSFYHFLNPFFTSSFVNNFLSIFNNIILFYFLCQNILNVRSMPIAQKIRTFFSLASALITNVNGLEKIYDSLIT